MRLSHCGLHALDLLLIFELMRAKKRSHRLTSIDISYNDTKLFLPKMSERDQPLHGLSIMYEVMRNASSLTELDVRGLRFHEKAHLELVDVVRNCPGSLQVRESCVPQLAPRWPTKAPAAPSSPEGRDLMGWDALEDQDWRLDPQARPIQRCCARPAGYHLLRTHGRACARTHARARALAL